MPDLSFLYFFSPAVILRPFFFSKIEDSLSHMVKTGIGQSKYCTSAFFTLFDQTLQYSLFDFNSIFIFFD